MGQWFNGKLKNKKCPHGLLWVHGGEWGDNKGKLAGTVDHSDSFICGEDEWDLSVSFQEGDIAVIGYIYN